MSSLAARAWLAGRNTARLDPLVGGDLQIPAGAPLAEAPTPAPANESSISATGVAGGLVAVGVGLGALALAAGGARRWLRRSE